MSEWRTKYEDPTTKGYQLHFLGEEGDGWTVIEMHNGTNACVPGGRCDDLWLEFDTSEGALDRAKLAVQQARQAQEAES